MSSLATGSFSIEGSGSQGPRPIKQVAVLGAGTMGHGIAQLASLAGCDVIIRDIKKEFLESGLKKISWSLDKLVEKDKVTRRQADEAFTRIRTSLDLNSAVSGADLVIEAVPEDLKLKKEIFTLIDRYAPAKAILASNTSAMPIEEIADATSRPQNVIGMHFFNPPQLMPLVEITPCTETLRWVTKAVEEFATRLGKEIVLCKKYVPGFIVNNILGALTRAAILTYENKEATPEQIDSALKSKAGFPMGLFEVADYSGLDILYNIENFYRELGYQSYVSPSVKKLVGEGRLGAKTGRGFYEWKEGKRPEISRESGKNFDVTEIIAVGANAAAELIRNGVADRDDIDKALKLGLGYQKGILQIADQIGLDKILESLRTFNTKRNPNQRYLPSALLSKLVAQGDLGKKSWRGFYDYIDRN
jgi:enoyl-CoA hydratase / 3-hydroxyacyl-CoA dehydrogenase